MREIKFRQWDKRNKRFHYFGFEVNDFQFTAPVNPSREHYPVSQYTGLKDPKGVEIYEGDIVLLDKMVLFDKYADRGDGSCDDVLAVTKDDLLAVTKWDDHYQGFMYKHLPETPESAEVFMFEYAAEVVGNIYENPELLSN